MLTNTIFSMYIYSQGVGTPVARNEINQLLIKPVFLVLAIDPERTVENPTNLLSTR